MLDNQNFIAPVVTIVKRVTEKTVDVESKREDRRRKFIEAAYSTCIQSTLTRNWRSTDIFDDRTNKKTFRKMSEEQVSK